MTPIYPIHFSPTNFDHILAMHFLGENSDLTGKALKHVSKLIDALMVMDLPHEGLDQKIATSSIFAALIEIVLEHQRRSE